MTIESANLFDASGTGFVSQQGFIGSDADMGSGGNAYTAYGAIAVNAAGDAVIGCAGAGDNIWAGAYYAFKRSSD
jgi:hypothetical protein